jgi:hypothetical protein
MDNGLSFYYDRALCHTSTFTQLSAGLH